MLPGPGGMMGRGGPGAHMAMLGASGRARNVRGTARRLWGYLKGYRAGLLGVILFVAATSLFALLGPYLLGRAIDEYIVPGNLPGLAKISLVLAGVYLLSALTTWLQTYVMVDVSQKSLRDLRRHLFDTLQSLSLKFFDAHPHGELMSRLTNDIENISNVLTQGVTQLLASSLTTIGVVVAMFLLNPLLAAVTLVTLPVMILASRFVAGHTRRGFRDQQDNLGKLNGIIEETVTGQRVVTAFSRQAEEISRFDKANAAVLSSAITANTFAGLMGPMGNFLNNFTLAVVGAAGGWFVVLGVATVGTVAAFINYTREFVRPLNQIAVLYNSLQSALAGAERVFEIIDEVPEIRDAENTEMPKRIEGRVTFENVCFGYRKSVPVLKQVSFEARPGKAIALVGPTGAGKTTIVNLLTRFYDIDTGAITIDGRHIYTLPKAELRRKLGIVLQDTYLFTGSVAENIRYGRLDATDEEIRQAARLANAEQFIHRLPGGYETPLSEDGSNLSQGQRQLLAIARAALADPAILILDEATSSVDTRTEAHIQEAMLRLMQGRTSFIIAHRLSTIRKADQILVIDRGVIVERGTHTQLLASKGLYHRLYTSQFRGHRPPDGG
jgi:ATP-binding cassette subfamily B multidrug efflux pump